MKKVLIAGGQCGITMLRAKEKILERADQVGISLDVKIHDLWMSSVVDTNCDVIIEMFPYFDELPCPVLDGKPFITRLNEDNLISKVIELLEKD